ncbi:uncharacterized protein LOC118506273 isoform X1 [Anopheles stephensi]|uniref:uncharacterized protein LOC118506273 isoform X1 n=1 Tax=Anopheles stephensi TaxID=30069 RepID=UPI0016588B85|nr:uncharacterized protein LOC118506273 isoform X1 [Anopheles stephensi]
MASTIDKRPNFRISDVEELMRETGMDNSDTGIGIVNYFRRRHADFHRGRLFDGSDNQINFRLDNLQPVQLPPPARTNDTESSTEARVGVVMVKPLSEMTVAEHRAPSFISPGRVADNSPSRNSPRQLSNGITIAPGRSSVHVSPMVSIPSVRKSSVNSLQRDLMLQRHRRENQAKMELLRNSASQLASSTPIAGEHSERRGENLLELRETISPIYEDAEHGTPLQRVQRTRSENHRECVVPGPSATYARAIRTPIPATQDAPDGMDRNDREHTPPAPASDENCMVVVPETPSPVRKSPRIPSTPLRGLSLTQGSHLAVPALAQLRQGQSNRALDIRSPVASTPSRSILKIRESKYASPRCRVSFSEQLVSVREMTPLSDDAHMTSDESDEMQLNEAVRNNSPAKPAKEDENAHHSRRLFGSRRSNAVEEWDENALHESPKRCNNRTNGNVVNMLMDDWNDSVSERMEVDESLENREPPPVAQRTINKSCSITNIDTPRTVMMEIFDPPSAFCDDEQEQQEEQGNGLNVEKSASKRSDSTRKRNQVEQGNGLNAERPAPEAPVSKRSDLTRKTQQQESSGGAGSSDGNDSDGSSRRNSTVETNDRMPRVSPRKMSKPFQSKVPESKRSDLTRKTKQQEPSGGAGSSDGDDSDGRTNDRMPRVSPRKMSKPSLSVTLTNVHQAERIVSVDSPNDHVPLDMIQAVDMIHSRVNSELADAGDTNHERRTTLNIPSKRRLTKPKVDAEAEMYLKTIETAGVRAKAAGKQRKERRKLFAQEVAESQREDEANDEPQPLPVTQDATQDTPIEQEPQQNLPRYKIKPLVVPVHRLSVGTINRATRDTSAPDAEEPESSKQQPARAAIESPVQEKQNEEQNEKGDRPKVHEHEQHGDAVAEEQSAPPGRGKSKRNAPKRTAAKNKKRLEKSDVTMEKHLKNVSNQLRHQIETEGPRRSHRNRRLAAEILRNNPNTLQTDAPKYVMPTIKDVLKYYQLAERPTKARGRKAKNESKPSAARKEAEVLKENVPPKPVPEEKQSVELARSTNERGRSRKKFETQRETFDEDGFRVPTIPVHDELPGPSSKRGVDHRSVTSDSYNPSLPQGVSTDSGLSSAVMTSEDATGPAPPPVKKLRGKQVPKKQHAVAEPEPSCSYTSAPATAASDRSDILAEKRKTLDWMMMLMEKQQDRPPALPMVELQGFTHLSVEHLVFEEQDGIEYSFYVYSNGDNFGFLRFPPKVEKRPTRTKRCSLKFLILSGLLQFTINEVTVKAVGGDFLMIPIGSNYHIVNGSDTSLMFMIKSSEKPVSEQTNRSNK